MKAKTKDIIISSVIGLIGAVVGIVASSFMNLHNEREMKRLNMVLASYKFDYSETMPAGYLDIKMLLDQMQNLSVIDSESIQEMAAIARKHPECLSRLSEECKPIMVKWINIMRSDLDLDPVSEEDLRVVLEPHYNKALRAANQLGWR